MKGRSRRKQKRNYSKKIAAILSICLIFVSTCPRFTRAEELRDPVDYYAENVEQFIEALNAVESGDFIHITGEIDISGNMEIGGSKSFTIERDDSNGYIAINEGIVEISNITFIGNDISTRYSMVLSYGDTVFNNCTFTNCGAGNANLVGGAVQAYSGSCIFNDCVFTGNRSTSGGAVAVARDSSVILNDCIFENNTSSHGGAVSVSLSSGYCEINGGIITGNYAEDYGGGIRNGGTMIISGAKIYNNSSRNGGADIATTETGTTILTDTIEELNELFYDDGIEVYGWISDYSSEYGELPDIDLSRENALLKLDYGYIEFEPESDPETEPETDPEDLEDETDPEDEDDPEDETDPDDENESDEKESEDEKGGGNLASSSDAEREESVDSDSGRGGDELLDAGDAGSGDDASGSLSNDSGSTNTSDNTSNNTSNTSSDTNNTSNTSSGSGGRSNSSNSTSSHSSGSSGGSSGASSATVVATYSSGVNDYEESETVEESETYESAEIIETAGDSEVYSSTTETVINVLDPSRQTGAGYFTGNGAERNGVFVEPNVGISETESETENIIESPDDSEVTIETNNVEETENESENESPNIRIDAKNVDCVFEFKDGEYNISINGSATYETKGGIDWLNIIQCVLLVGILICFFWKPKDK